MRGVRLIGTLGLLGLVVACGGVPRPTEVPDLMPLLESPDPAERAWAVSQLCRKQPDEALGGVVARLRDEDGGIRLMTVAGLREWTGEEFGYLPFAPEGEREAAVNRWESWLAPRSGGAP